LQLKAQPVSVQVVENRRIKTMATLPTNSTISSSFAHSKSLSLAQITDYYAIIMTIQAGLATIIMHENSESININKSANHIQLLLQVRNRSRTGMVPLSRYPE
jgi:hypothetical protein